MPCTSATHDGRSLAAFRAIHTKGRNFVVAPYVSEAYRTKSAGLEVTVLDPGALRAELGRSW